MQYTFSTDKHLVDQVDCLAKKEDVTRSKMIDILLRVAIKEKTRIRNGKKEIPDMVRGGNPSI